MGEAKIIRLAQAADLSALADLAFRSKATWGYDAAFMEACRAELTLCEVDLQTSTVAVIDGADGHPIAMVEVIPAGDVAELHKLFVDPSCQGDGFGRRLIAWAAETAHDMGATALLIEADPGAAAFYEKMGAKHVGEVPSGSIAGRVLPLFRVDL